MDLLTIRYNASTAIDDPRLLGDSLLTPFRLCTSGYQHTFSTFHPENTAVEMITELSQKILTFAAASVSIIPATPLAVFGIAIKVSHLSLAFEHFKSDMSMMGSYFPYTLDPFSRLGDRNVAYLNTRILADQAQLPLHFEPFKGCEMFHFNELEVNRGPHYFQQVTYINTPEQIEALSEEAKEDSTLYRLSYFPFTRDLEKESDWCCFPKIAINWQEHRDRLRELLAIDLPHTALAIPEDAHAIALHVRDGGTFDDDNTKSLHPLKLPTMDFYLGELERILGEENDAHENFFVHIFTDATDPEVIRDQVQAKLTEIGMQERVRLSYTPKDRVSLVDDVANMDKFDTMIRSDSNLSGPIAAKSLRTKHIVYPAGFDYTRNDITITEVHDITSYGTPDEAKVSIEASYSKEVRGFLPQWFKDAFWAYFGVYQTPEPTS